ncbi:hypothetical protein H5410_053883 [Solanum commersonii]|uniref:Uncharacterized protein n=1 Tax=Solanum commersonii TaxID=4109 RepID=A0A9J5X8I0_SOLCO|nr:hypothetical protein H5410_053883 [Solanum commersonii]
MRYFVADSLCSGFSRQNIDLVAYDEMYVDIIFLKLTIIEDLYLDKLFFENKGGVSKSWDPGISSKTMHQNGLMETTEAHLLLEFIDITSRLFNHFYDAHLKESTQSKERRKTTLRGLLVFPYVWLSLSQDNGWQVLLDIYTCVEANDMPSDIKLCALTLVYAALLEPKQERPVYNGQPHNNCQYMSIVCTTFMVPISVPKTTIVLVYGQEYILPTWLVHIHPNLRKMTFNMPMFFYPGSASSIRAALFIHEQLNVL